METITYKPHQARLQGRRLMSGGFIVVGAVVGLLMCIFGLIFALAPLALGIPLGLLPGLAAAIGGPLIGLVFVGLGIWMWKAQASGTEHVTLSADTFTYTDRSGTTTLRLAEIMAVDAEWRPGHWSNRASLKDRTYYPAYWTLIVRDQQGQTVRLQIAFPKSGRMTVFDVLPILRDLLARLPDHVPVNPSMLEYAKTGILPRPSKQQDVPSDNE